MKAGPMELKLNLDSIQEDKERSSMLDSEDSNISHDSDDSAKDIIESLESKKNGSQSSIHS